jgi:hypothetical protein
VHLTSITTTDISTIDATALTKDRTRLPLTRHINGCAKLLSEPSGQCPCGYTPRLRMTNKSTRTPPGFQAKLRQLRRFSRTRRPADNHNRMARQRLENLTSMRSNG